MSDMRLSHSESEPGNAGKIIAAIVVVIAIAVAGGYTYETGMWNPQVVSDNNLPSPAPVLNVPPRVPPAQQ